ncbi:MAG: LacI family DNA-binding transcriptional regulator [Pseudoflavonifractor sp.]
MAVTLKDIAGQVGVSPAAVSLVLNDRPNRISSEKRVLILETARSMNYVPNQNAVGLVKGRSKALGIVIPDLRNLFFSELVSGIDAVALSRGWNIIITSSHERYSIDLQNIRTLAARDMDGILLVPAGDADGEAVKAYRQALQEFGRPAILVDRNLPLKISRVAIHQRRGAALAIEHLFALGHRKIACLLGPGGVSGERLKGVEAAYRKRGIPLNGADLFPGDYTMVGGYAAADAIAQGGYTAVFSFNDMMAYGLYKRFRELGVTIPGDLSVVGFDDIMFSDYLDVPLTSVHQPSYNLGVEAANRAFYELENKGCPAETILLEPTLQIRKSTAAPR